MRRGSAGDSAPADAPLRLDQWIPYRMFVVASRTAELLGTFYAPRWGLSQASWRIMAILANRPGLSSKEICRSAALDQFAASRAIAQLVALGLAHRGAGVGDRRYAAVTLSRAGHDIFAEISTIGRRLEERLLDGFSGDERQTLDRFLDRLEDASAGVVARGWEVLAPRAGSDEAPRDGAPRDGAPRDGAPRDAGPSVIGRGRPGAKARPA